MNIIYQFWVSCYVGTKNRYALDRTKLLLDRREKERREEKTQKSIHKLELSGGPRIFFFDGLLKKLHTFFCQSNYIL
jgi:hypothetical protein